MRTITIIWGALLMSQVIYALIYLGVVPIEFPPEPESPVVPLVLTLVGLSNGMIALFFPAKITFAQWTHPETHEGEDRDTQSMFRDQVKTKRVATSPTCALASGMAPLFTYTILRVAMAESAAVFAIVTRFVGGSIYFSLGLGLYGATITLLLMPRRAAFARILERQIGAEIPLDRPSSEPA